MTGKQNLELILAGKVPDAPPHWELVFQIEKEMFGIDPDPVESAVYPSPEDKDRAVWAHQVNVFHRLVDELGWAAVPGGYSAAQVGFIKKALGSKALVVGYGGDGVFWMPSGQDIMDFVVKLYERPEELHAEARKKCDNQKKSFREMADAGADFIVMASDFGFNDGPFISPAHFRDLVTPYLSEIVQAVHDAGLKIILHSDGCLNQILDQIHSTGIDGYQSVDPQGHMDIKQVREQYPDWILMGNVACSMLQDTNEAKIRESVQYCMTYGGIGKPYIFSTSNCIFKGMPPESYRIMLDEYHRMIEECEHHAKEVTCGGL
jgi:uroporphyrinogen decarboxylase